MAMSDVGHFNYFTQLLLLRLWWSNRELRPEPRDKAGGINPLREELQAIRLARVDLLVDGRIIKAILKSLYQTFTVREYSGNGGLRSAVPSIMSYCITSLLFLVHPEITY
jgi:hypothetical protein